ncbi:MAG: immunoglobulin-like domain-containing protein [Lachnospiraceae bacterium]|jgi:hypothetical protein
MRLTVVRAVSAAVFILLQILWIASSGEKREWSEALGDVDGLSRKFACFGMRAAEWWEKSGHPPDPEEMRRMRALHVRGNPALQMRRRIGKRFEAAVLCLSAAAAIAFALSFIPQEEQQLEDNAIERPSFGETETVSLNVTGLDPEQPEEGEQITVEVYGQDPEAEAMQEVFDEAFRNVETQILGDNPSLNEVRTDLDLVSVTDWGIRVTWKSMNPDIISDSGRVDNSQVPEEGTLVTLRVSLQYAGAEALYNLFARVVPPVKDESFYLALLNGEIDSREKGSRDSDVLVLPDSVEGREISYSLPKRNIPWGLAVLTALLGIFYAAADRSRLKDEAEKRRDQLQKDYPVFLFRLCTLLSCGMTQRAAWFRITDSTAEEKGKQRYVYQEMTAARMEITAGKSEEAAYHDFGQRCGLDCYIRTAGTLSQNAKQGTAGLRELLESEMLQAFEKQKSSAVQTGEKMETKMLVPMFLMLAAVIVVLVAPAMLQMS